MGRTRRVEGAIRSSYSPINPPFRSCMCGPFAAAHPAQKPHQSSSPTRRRRCFVCGSPKCLTGGVLFGVLASLRWPLSP